jgi:hypothetical protein
MCVCVCVCVITQFQVIIATICRSLRRYLNLSYVVGCERALLCFIVFVIVLFLLIVRMFDSRLATGAITFISSSIKVSQLDQKLKWRI